MPTVQDDIDAYVTTLEDRLLDVEIKFIGPHTNPTEPVSVYAIDVQSYAVLCHAAFEEFAENLCMRMLDEIEDRWKGYSQYSKATMCLLHFDIENQNHSIDKWNDSARFYGYIKDEIHERKSKLSTYAIRSNHGVGVKYLHSLFLPIGLDMPQDVNEKNSLEQLVQMRGFFAHAHTASRPNAVTITSPQEASAIVGDVLSYMNRVADNAKRMSYYNW